MILSFGIISLQFLCCLTTILIIGDSIVFGRTCLLITLGFGCSKHLKQV